MAECRLLQYDITHLSRVLQGVAVGYEVDGAGSLAIFSADAHGGEGMQAWYLSRMCLGWLRQSMLLAWRTL